MRNNAFVALISLLLALQCSATLASTPQPIPAGPVIQEEISFEYAVYYLPRTQKDPLAALRRIMKSDYPNLKEASIQPGKVKGMNVHPRLITDARSKYPPPDRQSLQYFGRGLDQEQVSALQDSEQVLVLQFNHPKQHVWTAARSATRLVSALARDTGGLIWDEETREVFTPDAWDARRLKNWTGIIPNITQHTVIHAYKNEELVRAITLGMGKFGLPDVVVDGFSWSNNKSMGNIINLLCQSLAETGALAKTGQYDLDIRQIKNASVRDPQLASLKENASSVALLTLVKGVAEEGDPNNRLVQIMFDRYPGKDVHAKQNALLGSLFGWEDKATLIRHNEELLAASKRVKEKLPMLQKTFSTGLKPGEFILVKAPFATPTGSNEWMWVEIISWKGGKISGLLQNEPIAIPALHGGQTVEVSDADVFDYIVQYADGRHEGNETGKIIEKMRQAK